MNCQVPLSQIYLSFFLSDYRAPVGAVSQHGDPGGGGIPRNIIIVAFSASGTSKRALARVFRPVWPP